MEPQKVLLFGAPRVERDGQEVPVNRRKMLALLAYLLVSGQPHSREGLATLFWPEYDLSSALANLRRDLSRLKEVLGEGTLRIDREKVRIDRSAGIWLDVARFEDCLQQAEEHGHFTGSAEVQAHCAQCQAALEEAERLYREDFMAGFNLPDSPGFDEWQFFQAERLRGHLASVLAHLARWYIQQGAYESALAPARRWLALDALHEPTQRLMMQLYAWTGQPSAARRQYQLLVNLLQQELGADPEPETQALYDAIQSRRLTPPIQPPAARQAAEAQPSPGDAPRAPSEPPVSPAPRSADRYLPETHLSTGGFGEIYRGRDLLTGQEVAIKRLRPDLVARQPELVARFLREGQALSQLSHPNIVPMLDFFEHDGQYNLVMEYLPGGTLRDLLEREKSLPLHQALDIALELADALSRAHHLHILHRDLKPENILLDGGGHPRLIDFGLALLDGHDARLTRAGILMGSPAYMSPEALRGQERDARSDIWSFGVLLYEMLAGRAPFEGEQVHSLMQRILNEPPSALSLLRPDVPPALDGLIGRMLTKDYLQRLPSMRQAAAELEAIRVGKTIPPNGQAENGLHSTQAVHTPAVDNLRTPAPGSAHGRLVEFPAPRTPLIGREAELAHLHELLSNPDCRLITLVGTGGIGKTRLATEAAARFAGQLPDGAVFINLAPVSEADYIIPTFANALHLRFTPGSEAKEQLLSQLSDRSMLLVLDNFEHLLESADLVAEILAAAPQVRLLVTSRERLNLQEEWLYEVNGLPYPPPGEPVPGGAESWLKNFSAVQLFVERARRADPNLPVDAAALSEIIRICQLVEGMPLALELAAPWVRAMRCAEIVQELEHGFDILSTSMRNLPERHRSVRMVFDQSWQTLSPHEQSVLARMSAFHNGCTREAAEKVAGARPGLLIALVDKALLRYRDNRFEMHELVRQYATERLDLDVPLREETYDRHHRYYLDVVARMSPWLKGGRQVEAAQTMNAEIDNIRWGWRRALQREDRQAILQAAEAYWLYNEFRGTLAQGEAAFRKAAERFQPEQGDLLLAGFMRAAQGSLLARQWQLARGRELMEEGLRLLRAAEPPDPEKTAFALAWFAFLLVLRGSYMEAAQYAQESLAYFPQTGDRWTQAGALRLLGAASLYQGQLQRAQEYLDQCVEVCKAIGELRIRTYATSNLGAVYLWYGQLEQARQYFDESLRVSMNCNDRLARADALCEHSRLFLATGEFERAVDTARSCITIYRQLGRSQVSLANIVLGKALQLSKQPGAEEALNEGLAAARSVEQKPDIATGLEGQGILALDRQEYEQAERYFREALEIWTEVGNEPEIGMLLCRSAHGLLASGSADIARVRAQFFQALQLSHKHLVGTIALSAMVGLCAAQLHTGEGETSRVAATLLLAQRHPATPHEVRGWAKQLLEKLPAQLVAEESPESQALSWQTLAERWEGVRSPAGD